MIIDNILEKAEIFFDKKNLKELETQRFKAINETTSHQFESCVSYRQFCKQKNFNPLRDLKSSEDISKIPYLTTANFKVKSGKPKGFLCVPESDIQIWTLSSGTSGDPSMIGRDNINLVRYFRAMHTVFSMMSNCTEYDWTLMFQPPVRQRFTIKDKVQEPQHHMSYIFNVENRLPMDKRVYALKLADEEARKQGKMFEFDPDTTFGFLNSNPKAKGYGWIGGAVPIIYSTLKGYYDKTGQVFDIGEESFLIFGGGWKTYSGPPITPEKFREDMSKILGIPKQHILDTYSFTETDCFISECEYHNKHCLPWQDVIIRDVETLEPVEMGERGLINIINPIAYSYAGISILQDDIARITMVNECPCGRQGKILEIEGRAEGAEARGCGAQIADDTLS
ncbi:MAG: hypothetical protein ACFFDK_08540 [Promethearchaeota archaeon]